MAFHTMIQIPCFFLFFCIVCRFCLVKVVQYSTYTIKTKNKKQKKREENFCISNVLFIKEAVGVREQVQLHSSFFINRFRSSDLEIRSKRSTTVHRYGGGRITNCTAVGFVLVLQTPAFRSGGINIIWLLRSTCMSGT